MRLLFVKERLVWPRSSGHDVHTYYSMQALSRLGHAIGLITLDELDTNAIEGCHLQDKWCLEADASMLPTVSTEFSFSKSQEKFRSYWGIEKSYIQRIGQIADEWQADAVIVVGLNVLPYLGAVKNAVRVWYAADEWVWHHLSQIQLFKPASWGELKQAILKGLYERAFAPLLDRVWMVSEADKRAINRVVGIINVDVLPNGVDTEHYQPLAVQCIPNSCTFWGRLDFGPNIQALEWFCSKVWSGVRQLVPDARFTVYGFQPTEMVKRLIKPELGIELHINLPDLRKEIARHQVVVLPFVSGGGIKNKLLEAAAMGKAIIGSARTFEGLSAGNAVQLATQPEHWFQRLIGLWKNTEQRNQLGIHARDWVNQEHTWKAVALKAVEGLDASLVGKR